MLRYKTYGPHAIPRRTSSYGNKTCNFSKEALCAFWTEVEAATPGLSSARGCYIFAVRAAKGIKPWYIGQSKTGFKSECFQPQKRDHYHHIVNDTKKGTPVLIFVARRTTHGFAQTLSNKEADFVEGHLIGLALVNNSKLRNVKRVRHLREVQIPGVLNSPKGNSKGANLLRKTLIRG